MPIERRKSQSGRYDTVMTECPRCGGELPDGKGFAYHWQTDCPKNPTNQ